MHQVHSSSRLLKIYLLVFTMLTFGAAVHAQRLQTENAASFPKHEMRLHKGVCYCVPETVPMEAVPEAVLTLIRPAHAAPLPVRNLNKRKALPRSASIQVTYLGNWSLDAVSAFNTAASLLGSILTSPVPIKVRAVIDSSQRFLASCSPRYVSFTEGGFENIFLPAALAKSLNADDYNPTGADFVVSVNSRFNWYYGTDALPDSAQFDFVTIILHELFHGVGFASSAHVALDTAAGSFAGNIGLRTFSNPPRTYPTIFDLGLEDFSTVPLSTYPSPSEALYFKLTGNALFFGGANTRMANGNLPARIFAPSEYLPGSSSSHLDEFTYPAGSPDALMTPFFYRGEAIHTPGNMLISMLRDLSWDTQPLPPATPLIAPNPLDFYLTQNYPNPFNPSTKITFALPTAHAVTLRVYDLTGREVAQVLNGEEKSAGVHEVRFTATALSSGIYFYRLTAGGFSQTKKMCILK